MMRKTDILFRYKAKKNPSSLEEITKEVEIVRSKRYAKA